MEDIRDYIEGLPKEQLMALRECLDIIKYETWPRERSVLLLADEVWTVIQWSNSLMRWCIVPKESLERRLLTSDGECVLFANEIMVERSSDTCELILELLPTHPMYFLSAHCLFRKHITPGQQGLLEHSKTVFRHQIRAWR